MADPTEDVLPDLLEIADALYALPLAEFTPARDARARELKGTPVAPRVKALRKPGLAAWALNLLVRREHEQVAQVLAVGEGLRAAQERMSAAELRELTKQRRQLTAAVTSQARWHARTAGVRLTEAVAQQVEASLTAAILSAAAGDALRTGLLVQPLTATGVDDADPSGAVAVAEALAAGYAAAPVATPAPVLHVVADTDRELAEARAAVAELAQRLGAGEAAVDRCRQEVARLEARALELESRLEELRRRTADLEAEYEQVDDALVEAEQALRVEQEEHEAIAAEHAAAAARLRTLGPSV